MKTNITFKAILLMVSVDLSFHFSAILKMFSGKRVQDFSWSF